MQHFGLTLAMVWSVSFPRLRLSSMISWCLRRNEEGVICTWVLKSWCGSLFLCFSLSQTSCIFPDKMSRTPTSVPGRRYALPYMDNTWPFLFPEKKQNLADFFLCFFCWWVHAFSSCSVLGALLSQKSPFQVHPVLLLMTKLKHALHMIDQLPL